MTVSKDAGSIQQESRIVFDGWGEKYNAQCKNPAKVGRQYEECAILWFCLHLCTADT